MARTSAILYCGDTALREAGAYLTGVMSHFSIPYEYLSSSRAFSSELLSRRFRGMILSDYPAANFTPDQLTELAERIHLGMGFLMIGGWASFSGAKGEYTDTVLKEVLPVVMEEQDDRVNSWQPCLIERVGDHPILGRLPFDRCPPSICGFNRFRAKDESETILTVRQVAVSRKGGRLVFSPSLESHPVLVLGQNGSGRVGAFAGDVAPHWAGGLVDWGDSRISLEAEGASRREVGNWYAAFFERLIRWVMKEI